MTDVPTGWVIELDDVGVVACYMSRCEVASVFSCFADCPGTNHSKRAFLCERHAAVMLRCLPTNCVSDHAADDFIPHDVVWRHDLPYGFAR